MNTGVMQKVVAAGTALLIMLPVAAGAMELRAGERSGTSADESALGDTYLAGGTVLSAAAISGDLVTAGGTIIVSGPVGSDLTAVGGSVSVSGDVGDDLRAAGGTLIVQGSVNGDIVLAAGQVEVAGTGIGGDAAIAGGTVNIDAPIAGSLKVAGGEVRINALVVGDVDVRADRVVLGPKADIQGALRYTSAREAAIDPAASLAFEPEYTAVEKGYEPSPAGIAAIVSLALFAKLLMSLVGALAVYFFFPRYARETVLSAGEKTTASIGIGIVFLIVVPIVSLFLLLTIIGLPLGALGMVGYIGALIAACIVAPITLGSFVNHWVSKKGYVVTWKTILIGVVVYALLGFIPLIGGLAKFIVFILTLGALLSIKWNVAKEWR